MGVWSPQNVMPVRNGVHWDGGEIGCQGTPIGQNIGGKIDPSNTKAGSRSY